jgi:hypothetical protein
MATTYVIEFDGTTSGVDVEDMDTTALLRKARRKTGIATFERTMRGWRTPGTAAHGSWCSLRRFTEQAYRVLVSESMRCEEFGVDAEIVTSGPSDDDHYVRASVVVESEGQRFVYTGVVTQDDGNPTDDWERNDIVYAASDIEELHGMEMGKVDEAVFSMEWPRCTMWGLR